MDLLKDIDDLHEEYFGSPVSPSNNDIHDNFLPLSDDDTDSETHNTHTSTDERIRQYVCQNERHGNDEIEDTDIEHGIYENVSGTVENCVDISEDSDLLKIKQAVENGCVNGKECLKQFSLKEIIDHILNLKEMSKSEKELLIMGTLQVSNTSDRLSTGKRKRIRYSFSFKDKPVCRECFKLCFDIGEKHFRNLKAHLDKNGRVPREHGNTGRKPHNALKYNDTKRVVDFLVGYANEFGLPQPAAPRGRDDDPPIYLASSETILNLHGKYKTACEEAVVRYVGSTSFRDIWLSCCPHIKISGPKEDVCYRCEKIKQLIMDSTTEDDKVKYSEELKSHIDACKVEREVYKMWLKNSADELHHTNRPAGPVMPLSTDYKHVHYTFDFSQNFTVPHRSRQIGPLYFVSARKIQMFGVRIDGVPIQYNYLIDENQTIGKDGGEIHGPNAVISMVHHALTNYSYGEKECGLHADNCSGQNKNFYLIAYFCWRVMTGLHESIHYMMQIAGHARCLIDAGFAHSKKLYRRSDADTVEQIADIVDKGASTNIAVLMNKNGNEFEWEWRNWKTFLSTYFKKLPGIRQYQHFRFSRKDPGHVFVKKSRDADEIKIKVLKPKVVMQNLSAESLPPVLAPSGFSVERARYLRKTLRQYVRPSLQETWCPVNEE